MWVHQETKGCGHPIMSWYSPATRKSVKIKRQQQQKLTGLWEAASEGRKRRLQASLQTHKTAAPSNTPSMAATQHTHVGLTYRKTGFLFLPQGGGAQECQALCWRLNLQQCWTFLYIFIHSHYVIDPLSGNVSDLWLQINIFFVYISSEPWTRQMFTVDQKEETQE